MALTGDVIAGYLDQQDQRRGGSLDTEANHFDEMLDSDPETQDIMRKLAESQKRQQLILQTLAEQVCQVDDFFVTRL